MNKFFLLIVFYLIFPGHLQAAAERALDPLTLQLKWSHAFQFAGYYAARELGYYREAGLDVHIEEAAPGVDSLKEVLDGKAQYGVGTSSLLLARRGGHPVVALAVIFQHSPLVLIARQRDGAQSLHDLVGKRAMIEPQSDELLAYLKQEGIAPNSLTQIVHSHNPQDLADGKIDAMSAYITSEPFYLERTGRLYQTYTPRAAGIDFYGDNLFTTEQELRTHPARVKAFRDASLRGWEYAMAHPEEIADLIFTRYSQQHSRDYFLFEAKQMVPLLRPELIEIGYMNPGRWRHIADTYADLGLLPRNFPLKGFLYEPDAKRDLTWLYAALALLGVTTAIALYISGINRRLARALAASKEAEQALRTSEERHRLLADHASDVIWTMNLDGKFTYVSPSVEKLRGYSVAEVMQQTLDDALTPDSAAIAATALQRACRAVHEGLPVPEFRSELEQPCKDGGTVWTETSVTGMRNSAGEFAGFLGVTRDISGRRQIEERIRHMAQHDMLTGLPNRTLFSDRLHHALSIARRDKQPLAVMFIDLDKFKPVNDKLGHATGDVLLKEVAARMLEHLRESDTVARIGGDEFVVLLRNVDDPQNALAVAEKIRTALCRPFSIAGHHINISASIGIALYPEHGADELELSKNADFAMYQAKNTGHNNVKLYQPEPSP